jgi:type I restriction enzyme, S subunit
MMSEWHDVEFQELLVDGSISYGIVQPGSHVEKDFVPVLRVNNIRNGRIETDGVLQVASEIEAKYSRTRLEGGELLITVVGNPGQCAIVPTSLAGFNVARAVSVARINQKADKRFVKYALQSDDLIFQIYGGTNDTVQPTLNLSSLKTLCFNLPGLSEQIAIADVLSSLDDKIDLLHRQNKTLEALAETLFRQWFVEEASESANTVALTDVLETCSGGTPSRAKMEYYAGGTVQWVKSKELTGSFVIDTEEKITEDALKASATKLLPESSILIALYGATVGEYAILAESMSCNQAVCAIKPSEAYPYTFLFMYFKHIKEDLINMAVGSAQQNISQVLIRQLELPSNTERIREFHAATVENFAKMKSNTYQIRTLENLRDTLLPKLMSGEVRVHYE